MHKVYSFRERLSGSFTPPEFRFEDPQDYKTGLTRFILVKPAEAFQRGYDSLELYYLGLFDDEHCKFDLLESPELVFDMGPICEQQKARLNIDA